MPWSPEQYLRFEAERTRPVRDLLAAIPTAAMRTAVDLGCGPGNSTEALLTRFPQAQVLGVDSSAEMIVAARARLPEARFEVESIERWDDPGPFDLILANASLQWVADHEALLPRLMEKLSRGGSLAIQMPDNLDDPAHLLMEEAGRDPRWRDRVSSGRAPRRSVDWYYQLLQPRRSRCDIWLTVYHHPLPGGVGDIVEWFKGTALRPYLAVLDEAEQALFLERYRALLDDAYSTFPDGSLLLPFPRLFIVATR